VLLFVNFVVETAGLTPNRELPSIMKTSKCELEWEMREFIRYGSKLPKNVARSVFYHSRRVFEQRPHDGSAQGAGNLIIRIAVFILDRISMVDYWYC
jgi:hypothetical protein